MSHFPFLLQDDNWGRDEDSTDDGVDTEEESQILVPISHGKGSDCCVNDWSNRSYAYAFSRR